MQKSKTKFSKGFGILEVLISSAIIIVVLGTLVFIAQSSLTNAAYMQERAQAVSLAAEAIETVRQNRDSNYIDLDPLTKWNTVRGGPDDTGVFPISYTYSNYSVSFTGNRLRISLYSIATPPVAPIIINVDGVKYTRKISFKNISNDSVMSRQLLTSPVMNLGGTILNTSDVGFEVLATVTWSGSGGKAGSVVLRELITNSRFVY